MAQWLCATSCYKVSIMTRCLQVLLAIAGGAWLLDEAWVRDSLAAGAWLPEAAFLAKVG